MKHLVFCLLGLVLNSCIYPYFRDDKIRKYRVSNALADTREIDVSSYHFSAALRRGSFWDVRDTLYPEIDIETMLRTSLQNYNFQMADLSNHPCLKPLIDPHLRWKNQKLLGFLESQSPDKKIMTPIVCYNASVESEKSGGGGIGPVYETGNDRYNIARELYLALYHEDGELVYLKKVIQWDEKIVPAGTPITHEFPQAVLDTLMHMALEPLLKQMDKTAAKQQKR